MYQEYLNQLQVSIAPLSSDELKNLLNDDEKLEEKVDEVLEGLKQQKTNVLAENRLKAEKNIDKEPQIIELRSKVNQQMTECKDCCAAVTEKLTKLKEKSGDQSQETALALLQTAAAESEEESENLMKKFTDNEVAVDAFLDGFLSARKTMHLRKLKAEKMQELIRKQKNGGRGVALAGGGAGGGASGNMHAYSNFPPPSSGFFSRPSGAGAGVPYPTGPMMPMPMPPPRPY